MRNGQKFQKLFWVWSNLLMFVFSFLWTIPEDHGPHSLEPTQVVPPKIKFRGLPRVCNERLPWSKTFRMSFANPSWTQLLKNGKRQSFLQSLSVVSACAFPISNHNLLFQSNSAFKSSKDRMSCKDSWWPIATWKNGSSTLTLLSHQDWPTSIFSRQYQ